MKIIQNVGFSKIQSHIFRGHLSNKDAFLGPSDTLFKESSTVNIREDLKEICRESHEAVSPSFFSTTRTVCDCIR